MSGPPVETQPERTGLAWQRTALGVLAVAGLIGHGAALSDDLVLVLLAGGVALLGLVLLGAVAPVRYRRLVRAIAAGTAVSAPRLAGLVTGAVIVAAIASAFVVLTRS